MRLLRVSNGSTPQPGAIRTNPDWSFQIPNSKFQITNKFQSPISNDPNSFVLDFGHWCLFGIWCLGFGAYSLEQYCCHVVHDFIHKRVRTQLPAQDPSRKLDLESKMENDVRYHDSDKSAGYGNPGLCFSEAIKKRHEAEGHEQKTDSGQKRRI